MVWSINIKENTYVTSVSIKTKSPGDQFWGSLALTLPFKTPQHLLICIYHNQCQILVVVSATKRGCFSLSVLYVWIKLLKDASQVRWDSPIGCWFLPKLLPIAPYCILPYPGEFLFFVVFALLAGDCNALIFVKLFWNYF